MLFDLALAKKCQWAPSMSPFLISQASLLICFSTELAPRQVSDLGFMSNAVNEDVKDADIAEVAGPIAALRRCPDLIVRA